MTVRRHFYPLLAAGTILASTTWMAARPAKQNPPRVRVSVEMVQLYVAVTDKKGRYITGLQPGEFEVAEDGIREKMAMFAEGDNAPKRITEFAGSANPSQPDNSASVTSADSAGPDPLDGDRSPLDGASVFILFDTSNYMYRGFVYAQQAISDFVRSLRGPDRIALYSYSRDLFRASSLTPDRMQVLRGIRTTVAGDDAALYDAMLLTLRDSANLTGRKVIVVFSNGPDNASLAPPEDVEELAQSEGVSIYMVSTKKVEEDPLSTKVFKRVSSLNGRRSVFCEELDRRKERVRRNS